MSDSPLSLDDRPERDELTNLLNRFFEFARPIADACHEPGLDMRLSDPGGFAAHVQTLEQHGFEGIEQTLLVFLDEFSQLEQRSYDELYLWSIIELSRRNPDYVDTFWPLALTLDLRFRSEPWIRPPESALVAMPYRMTELVLYHYVMATREPEPDPDAYFAEENVAPRPRRRYPSLATCLRRILRKLSEAEVALVMDMLQDLARQTGQPAFGDARGLLLRVR